jgi:hypothetical protein
MSHTYTLISFGEKWRFKTDHCLDMDTRQVFEDLLSFRDCMHWDEMDLENFLAVKGRLVSECITQLHPDNNDVIPAVLASEKFKNIKELIVCIYGHGEMPNDDGEKILNQIYAAVPEGMCFLSGWIRDEKADQNSVTIKLIAVCSE